MFTASVDFVSEWQHARNYISTHWADWTWMDRGTKSPVFRRGKSGNPKCRLRQTCITLHSTFTVTVVDFGGIFSHV